MNVFKFFGSKEANLVLAILWGFLAIIPPYDISHLLMLCLVMNEVNLYRMKQKYES